MRYLFILYLLTSLPTFAQQPVSTLKAKLQKASVTDKINFYKEISQAFVRSSPDSAVYYCNQGLRLAERSNDRRGQAILLLELGNINAIHHHTDLARRFDNEALSIFRNLNDRKGIATAYEELGLLDGQQKNITSATRYLGQAMDLYQQKRDSGGIEQTYQGLGAVFEEKGDIEKALSYNLSALALYKHFNPKPAAYFDLLTRTAHLYLEKGDKATALRYFKNGINNSQAAFSDNTHINLLEEEGNLYVQAGEKAKRLKSSIDLKLLLVH
jgi:tetratricopeptide (TPR) repeat protein